MKRLWVVVVSVALGLWSGYYLGYHHGQQGELAAWLAAEEVEFDAKTGQLEAVYQSSVPSPAGARKFVQRSKRPSRFCYYADPHTGFIVDSGPRRAENVPDPRSMLVK
jgi:hypothetical protein